jgi:hypothetical protein
MPSHVTLLHVVSRVGLEHLSFAKAMSAFFGRQAGSGNTL